MQHYTVESLGQGVDGLRSLVFRRFRVDEKGLREIITRKHFDDIQEIPESCFEDVLHSF